LPPRAVARRLRGRVAPPRAPSIRARRQAAGEPPPAAAPRPRCPRDV